ncbi:MAG: cell envelope integrity protein TolA [Candidatus Pacebacteria bacterium]|nr:cell envelope integrity protein TolA [Candidatus Paceibacterota bacterium]
MIRASLMLRSLVILCTLFFVFAPFSFEMGSIADGVVALQENTALAQSPTTGLLGEDNVITIWSIIKGEHSFVDVFSILIYWIIAYPLFYITRAVAMVLDIMLFLSVSSSTYSSLLFIREGWEIVRDIANIGFIFALLYVAIGLTLDLQQVNVKKLLVNIVIVALLINFSLFFARVIVDAGNILARVFYNNITVIDTGDFDQSIIGAGQDPVKNVSAAIMAKVRPQALLSKDLYNAPIGANGIMPSSTEKALLNLFVILLLIIVYIALLGAFVTVSVLFLVRIVSIAISMILAPLAFATLMFPGASGISRIGFSSWIGELVKISFMAPVFIFFLYIILRFLSIDTFISVTPGATFWVQIMQVVIPLAILIGLIYAAKNIATKMSGEMGEKAAGFAGKVSSAIGGVTVGAGLAVATGGAALAAQSTIGRAGNALANSDFAKGMIRSDSAWIQKAGMSLQSAGKKAATSSFDWRQTSLGQKAVAATGLNTMGAENAFAGASIGGYTGAQERKEKSKIEREKAITEAAEVKKGDKERKDLDLAEKERDKLNQTEQQLNTKYATELEYFAKAIADAREKMKDAGTPAEKSGGGKRA